MTAKRNCRCLHDQKKEIMRMPKRLAVLGAVLGVTAVILSVMPLASASASSPWWQVLTGSRPSNLWEPTDSRQEIRTKAVEGFAAARIKVGGQLVGCLGTGAFFGIIPADEMCHSLGLAPEATESAAELEVLLEGAYGLSAVEVSGGPVGGAPFLVTVPKQSVQAIFVEPALSGSAFGEARAKTLSVGGSGHLVLTLTNLGDAPIDGSGTPVKIVDELPEGVIATDVEAVAGFEDHYGPIGCSVESPDEVACAFAGELPPFEAIEVEIHASLSVSPPVAGLPGKVTVTGGGASAASVAQTVNVTPEPVHFGIERFSAVSEEEGGKPYAQGGGHPFQFTTTLQLNAGRVTAASRREGEVEQPALPRNLRFQLPVGLVGNATATPTCSMEIFVAISDLINSCPDDTVLGVSSVTFVEHNTLGVQREAIPIFNLQPSRGEPARFGFVVVGVPVVIDTSVDPGDRYRIIASVTNITQVAQFLSSTTTFWGTPGDPRHDNARGWSCVYVVPGSLPCTRPANLSEKAFLRQPVNCDASLDFDLEVEPWNVPIGSQVVGKSFGGDPLRGCSKIPFNPDIKSAPTSKLAQNPSGLEFRLDMPSAGLSSKSAIAEGQAKKVEVTLPEGMSINPSEGEGLVGCTEGQYANETADSRSGEGCPEASKIGTVQISSPLLEEEARGSLFVASPHDNPFDSLVALYMVAKIPERGILIKQAGRVDADAVTGQLTTTFDNLPQLPFSSFKLQFRPGGRAPLVTPPVCGSYEVVTHFAPWSAEDSDNPAPDEIVTRTSSFDIQRGVDGGACPSGGTPPFHPGLQAGTINNAAGHFSPFNVRLTRKDGEQEFTNFSLKLPPGLSGKLAGIPFCPDAAIAAAKGRTGSHGGQEELDAPSCPAASEVGRTLVGAGVGSSLTYVPGKVYLAGPYNGSSLSIAAITAAKVGPFDLGTVVVREALRVNPDTAEVFIDATGSDPIPHIIQGIPVHARDIRVYVDRPGFTLNPTSCEPTSVASTVLGSGLVFGSAADDNPVTVTTRFQAADCAALPFRPKLSMRLLGKTNRGGNPRLRATLRMNGLGEAGIARASVTLPHSEFLDQSHIRTVCTRVQFNAGKGNGAECPKGSVYGRARAWTPLLDEPVEGPVFLRSSSHPLPDLVAALQGSKIDVNLVGRIDSVGNGQIRNTFEAVPDAPVTKFVLEMQGGKKGLLENSTEICKGQHRVRAIFKGHNGKQHTVRPALKGDCGRKKNRRGS